MNKDEIWKAYVLTTTERIADKMSELDGHAKNLQFYYEEAKNQFLFMNAFKLIETEMLLELKRGKAL